ncbi:hypothetical protein LT493_22130 [Streptomyces tricolor]|nr:hypothetical protein [Streptomyces tricolor]
MLGVLVLSGATVPVALGCGFALLGAGFGTVMVAATQVIVRRAEVTVAGVAGGVRQTALNVGPAVGVAGATALLAAGTGPALLALAAVAALALPAARALPGPTPVTHTARPPPRTIRFRRADLPHDDTPDRPPSRPRRQPTSRRSHPPDDPVPAGGARGRTTNPGRPRTHHHPPQPPHPADATPATLRTSRRHMDHTLRTAGSDGAGLRDDERKVRCGGAAGDAPWTT